MERRGDATPGQCFDNGVIRKRLLSRGGVDPPQKTRTDVSESYPWSCFGAATAGERRCNKRLPGTKLVQRQAKQAQWTGCTRAVVCSNIPNGLLGLFFVPGLEASAQTRFCNGQSRMCNNRFSKVRREAAQFNTHRIQGGGLGGMEVEMLLRRSAGASPNVVGYGVASIGHVSAEAGSHTLRTDSAGSCRRRAADDPLTSSPSTAKCHPSSWSAPSTPGASTPAAPGASTPSNPC